MLNKIRSDYCVTIIIIVSALIIGLGVVIWVPAARVAAVINLVVMVVGIVVHSLYAKEHRDEALQECHATVTVLKDEIAHRRKEMTAVEQRFLAQMAIFEKLLERCSLSVEISPVITSQPIVNGPPSEESPRRD